MAIDDVLFTPAMFGQQSAMNAFGHLRQALTLDRMARYAQAPRPHMPREIGNPFFVPGAAHGGDDYSQFTYDPRARQFASQMLSPYGLQPLSPEQVNPNALLPNHGFFGNHPTLTRALEGGIFSAANTNPAETTGEGIQNVARGLIGGQQMRNAMLQRQFQTPFDQAKIFQDMQLHDAEIQLRRAQADKASQDPFPKYGERWVAKDGSVHAIESRTGEDKVVAPPGSVETKDPNPSRFGERYVAKDGSVHIIDSTNGEDRIVRPAGTAIPSGTRTGAQGPHMAGFDNTGTFRVLYPGQKMPPGGLHSGPVAMGEKAVGSQKEWDDNHKAMLEGKGQYGKPSFWLNQTDENGKRFNPRKMTPEAKEKWFQRNYGPRPSGAMPGTDSGPIYSPGTPGDSPDNAIVVQ